MPERRDIGGLSAELSDSERETFAAAYQAVAHTLVAAVQVAGGTVRIPADALDQVEGKVVYGDPQEDGSTILRVVDRIPEQQEREVERLNHALRRQGR